MLADAAFDARPVPGEALAIQFTDRSAPGPSDWQWSFGDGTVSTERNPRHVYAVAREYTVGLSVRLHDIDTWTDSEKRTITVASPLEASFTWEVIGPLTVRFTDTSSGDYTEKHWTAGDGNYSFTGDTTWIHHYAGPGDFTATLAISGPGGTFDKDIQFVTVPPPPIEPPVADFSFSPANGTVPHTVRFEDRSTGADAWQWDFGDGSTSTEPNPSHEFPDARGYAVSLTVANRDGVGTATKTVVVDRASPPPPPIAPRPFFPPSLILHSTASPQSDSVTVEGSVSPGTTGTTIARVTWDWGDGAVEDHPVPNTHTYTGAGSYAITVTAFQSDGQTTTGSVTVFVGSPTEPTITATPTVATPTPAVTTTTVPATVTVATVTPTATGVQPPPDFPWWLVAIIAAGLLAGGVAVVKGWPGISPPEEPVVPGLTIEPRGGLRRPDVEEHPVRDPQIEIEVRGGIRRER